MAHLVLSAFLPIWLGIPLGQPLAVCGEQVLEDRPLSLEFHSRHYQAPFSFELSEPAYIAVFRIRGRTADLVFPFLGPELRRLRFEDQTRLESPDNLFQTGVHLVPRQRSGTWRARSVNQTLPFPNYLLLVASREPLDFEGLNRLLQRGRSLGFVEPDLSVALAQAIVPNPEAMDWTAYLHWIR